MRTFKSMLFVAIFPIALIGCGGTTSEKTFDEVGKGLAKKGAAGKTPRVEVSKEPAEKSKGKSPWRPEASRRPDSPTAMVGRGTAPKDQEVQEPQSGILTAGSFDDNLDPNAFRSFVAKISQGEALSDIAGKLIGNKLILTVKGSDGKPVGGARVHISGTNLGQNVELVTRTDGRVIFIPSFDSVPPDEDLLVTVTPPNDGKAVSETVPRGKAKWEIVLPKTPSLLPRRLDLAIVLDTTQSMADEMRYLKSELRNIAMEINKRFPKVEQRYALVVYRDERDAYVVRPFPFTRSLATFRKDLHEQQAAGGGDTPEAVHRGLEEAGKLAWGDEDTARVLFLVADAPPHKQFAERTLKAVNALRKKGVAVYPMASSGVEKSCEFFMRSAAMLTGAQYLFLTDDSGVGAAHAEPNIRGYHVQRLDHLMIRMISGELEGRQIPPRADRIIRTMGTPVEKIAQQ